MFQKSRNGVTLLGSKYCRKSGMQMFLVSLCVVWQGSASAQSVHVVREGETLWGVAQSHFKDAHRWSFLQHINQIKEPNLLQPGTPLQLGGSRTLPFPAKVLAVSGGVWIRDDKNSVRPLTLGMLVNAGETVQTDAQGFVSLVLGNGVHAVLPSSSLVQMGNAEHNKVAGAVPRFLLREGRVESYVPKRTNQPENFEVETPAAVLAVRGTHFRVRWSEEGSSLEVLEGTVAGQTKLTGRVGKNKPQLVTAHKGMRLDGAEAFEVRPLLTTPQLANSEQFHNEFETIFTIAPQAGVQAWRVQIAKDAGFMQLVRESLSLTTEVILNDLPSGFYYLRLTGIDLHGLEGEALNTIFFVAPAQYNVQTTSSVDGNVNFTWQEVVPIGYIFELASDAAFMQPKVSETVMNSTGITVGRMPPGHYFWRVIHPEQKKQIEDNTHHRETQGLKITRTGTIEIFGEQ